ncbi:MAG: LysM peptidoglycan-binding domain-containing protein [Candidatus Rifleibacteriota bacterium]
MIKRNRKGVIGFLLTMAVGVALGAAALVVSTEIKKDGQASPLAAAKSPSSPEAVEKAFEDYQQAYKAYQQAVGLGRKDVQKYADAYQAAKQRLEIEIFRNTPGVSEMDMNKFESEKGSGSDSSGSTATLPSGEPVDGEVVINPFAETSINLTGQTQTSSQSQAQAPQADTSPAPAQALSAATENKPISDNQITGMDYYRVKSGDSLSKICERFYGDSGMWVHILKYQIPSIVSTPNLIFPGQMIALPKGFSRDKQADSHVSNDSSSSSQNNSTPQGNHQVAAPGDESWQTRFQKDYLISDHTLTNSNTMTVAQIQRFLDAKGSCLAKPYRGSTPAQMIYNAAKKYGINPQVLLCRLQCEQGLISKKTATQKQLDWALGVGCYDSGNWNQSFKGLDKQIEFAAATYRRHFDNAQSRIKSGEKITMTIDGQSVRIKNAASYSFYKYCPHFQGNKLFYDVWNGYKKSF